MPVQPSGGAGTRVDTSARNRQGIVDGRQAVPDLSPLTGSALAQDLSVLCADPHSNASRLCADGAPVELAIVWPMGDLRVTCDPDPSAGAVQRMRKARDLCAGSLDTGQRAQVDRVSGWIDDEARFGGWVGARHRDGRIARKLYLDIPCRAPWRDWRPSTFLSDPAFPSRLFVPVMAGFDANAGGVEIYWRTPVIHPDHVRTALSRAGLPAVTTTLLAEVGRLTGRAVRDALPGADQGFSLAFADDGEVIAATWYGHAEQLLGPPEQARRQLLHVGAAAGWPTGRYAAASTPDAAGSVPQHGFVGVRMGRDGAIATSITLSLRAAGRT